MLATLASTTAALASSTDAASTTTVATGFGATGAAAHATISGTRSTRKRKTESVTLFRLVGADDFDLREDLAHEAVADVHRALLVAVACGDGDADDEARARPRGVNAVRDFLHALLDERRGLRVDALDLRDAAALAPRHGVRL